MASVTYVEYMSEKDGHGAYYNTITVLSKELSEIETYKDVISFYPEGGTYQVTGRNFKYDHGIPNVRIILRKVDDRNIFKGQLNGF